MNIKRKIKQFLCLHDYKFDMSLFIVTPQEWIATYNCSKCNHPYISTGKTESICRGKIEKRRKV